MNTLQVTTDGTIENKNRGQLIQLMIDAMQRRIFMSAEDFIALLEAIRACNTERAHTKG